jgi:hypothetical protein
VVLGRNPREGEAFGGQRRRSGREKRWGELGAREEDRRGVGDRGADGVRADGVHAHFERPVGGAAEREKMEKGGGSGRGVPHSAGGALGPGPD